MAQAMLTMLLYLKRGQTGRGVWVNGRAQRTQGAETKLAILYPKEFRTGAGGGPSK